MQQGKGGRNIKPVDERPFVTIRESVSRTGLSENYIRQLHREGQLPCIMSGNRCLVDVPALIEMMHQKSLKAMV